MCAWGARSSGRAFKSPDLNLGAATETREQAPQVFRLQRHAARRRREVRPRDMDKNGATAVLCPGARVVIKLDHKIVQMIVAPKAVGRTRLSELDRAIVAAVGRVFTPCVVHLDSARRQSRPWMRQAVSAPPKPHEPEAPAWRGAISLALVRLDAGTAKCHRKRRAAKGQDAARRPSGRACDSQIRPPSQTLAAVHVSIRKRRPHLPHSVLWSSPAPSERVRERHSPRRLGGTE